MYYSNPRVDALHLPATIRLLAIDDHPLVIDGLSAALRRESAQITISKALTCQEADHFLGTANGFDLILLDLNLPGAKGLRYLRSLIQRYPLTPVAILSASEDPEDVELSLACGATGFISKSAPATDILADIQQVLAGNIVRPKFATPSEAEYSESFAANPTAVTPRQMQVLELLAQGLPNKRICTTLNLTEDTVKSHLKSLFAHLNVHNRTECVRVASRLQLID